MKASRRDRDPFAGIRQGQRAFSLALSFAADLALWIVLGVWADRRFGPRPIWTMAGVVVGLASAAAMMVAMSRSMNRPPSGPGERENAP